MSERNKSDRGVQFFKTNQNYSRNKEKEETKGFYLEGLIQMKFLTAERG